MAGHPKELLKPKYERNGWVSQARPDIKPVGAWSMELLASSTRPRAHVISPDGTRIAFYWDISDMSDLYVMPVGGGWASRLTFDRAPVAFWSDGTPQWSPDSQWIAYTNHGHVWIIPASGGKPYKLSHLMKEAWSPRWLPDSHHLLVNASIEDFDRLILIDRTGNGLRTITSGQGHDYGANVSPDGQYIAYVHQPQDDFNRSDIWLANIKTGESRPLTGTPNLHDGNPQWSPDGKKVAFISERTGFHQLFLVDIDAKQAHQLTHVQHDIVGYEWSPNSSQLLCTQNTEGAIDLILVDAQTGAVQDLTKASGVYANPHWLSNGSVISYEYQDPQTPPDIYRMQLDNKAIAQLTFSKPPVLDSLAQVKPERVSYKSFDGMEIPAILYRPHKPNGAAIVYPHGGPTSQYVLSWDNVAQYFVAKGYTWIATNFRGSTGYGIDFERANHNVWGIDDTKDCLAAADYLSTFDEIDSKRIAIVGASYGSYMATCALAYDTEYRFACGVAKYGDCNILSSWTQGDQIGREDLERMMQHPTENREAWWEGSPILKVADIQKPLLIAHGLLDDRVHPLQSEELVDGLMRHDKVFEYITYADEGHGFLKRATQIDFHTRLERFLDWYLL